MLKPRRHSAAATVTPETLSASTQVTITAEGTGTSSVPTITWNAPAAISYGNALSSTQLNATANVPGTFVYTPAAGTVLKAGKQTLSTTFTPADTKTYSAATASVQLTVNQATPAITWAAPAAIAVGTALSATQLDATANVPGAFMYNPAAGAVLPAGTQQLTAVFSPTDATDYASATAHTSLVVSSPSSGTGGSPTSPTSPTAPPPDSSHGMRRSHHQPEQRHEPEHAAKQHHCGLKLLTYCLRRRHLQHKCAPDYPLRGEPYLDRAAHDSRRQRSCLRPLPEARAIFSTYMVVRRALRSST